MYRYLGKCPMKYLLFSSSIGSIIKLINTLIDAADKILKLFIAVVSACAMSVKNMFSSPFQEYLKAYNSKLSWANSSCSDCIAFLNAYMVRE